MNQTSVSRDQSPILLQRPSGLTRLTLQQTWLLLFTGLTLHVVYPSALQAQPFPTATTTPTPSTITPNSKLPEAEVRDPEPCTADCVFYTDDDISQTSFTQPSLWWSVRELGERLIPEWVVYPVEQRVDFTIDPQRWNWMNYFERYTLMTQLAYVLRPNHYDFQIFDPQQPDLPVASYTCEFAIAPPACQLHVSQ